MNPPMTKRPAAVTSGDMARMVHMRLVTGRRTPSRPEQGVGGQEVDPGVVHFRMCRGTDQLYRRSVEQ